MRNVQHLSDTSGRGPSGALIANFEDFSFSDMMNYSFMEDFIGFGNTYVLASNIGRYAGRGGAYKSFETTGASIAGFNFVGGGRRFTTGTTADAEANLESGDASGTGSFELLTNANKGQMIGFEARFKLHTAIAVLSDFFVGLAQPGLAVITGMFTTGDAWQTNVDYIGAGWIQSAPSVLQGRYQLGSAGAATTTTLTGQSAATLALDTWVKFGFLYNPKPVFAQGNAGVAYQPLTYFINGVAVPGPSTFLTDANAPLSRFLTPFISVKTDHTTHATVQLDVDWWYCLQQPIAGQ